jgi:hypothetical protein
MLVTMHMDEPCGGCVLLERVNKRGLHKLDCSVLIQCDIDLPGVAEAMGLRLPDDAWHSRNMMATIAKAQDYLTKRDGATVRGKLDHYFEQ